MYNDSKRMWVTAASLEVVTRPTEGYGLLRLDPGSPVLEIDPAFNETHAQRVMNALLAWITRREMERMSKKSLKVPHDTAAK